MAKTNSLLARFVEKGIAAPRYMILTAMRLLGLTIALIPLLAGGAYAARDSCFDCHSVMEGTSVVFKEDVHYQFALSCADCHGGDANEDDQNISMSAARGFKVRVTRQGTPDYCGSCHSDVSYMRKHNTQARVNQLALYRTSVHGRQLAAGHKGAAECVDCHSVHNIRAGSDPLSPAQPQHVTDTCAKCHKETADLFRKSPHGRAFNSQRRPGCNACHSSHATENASAVLFTDSKTGCVRCHKPGSKGDIAAKQIAQFLASLDASGPSASEALERARVAVHTFDVAAVKQAAKPPTPGGDSEKK
jgi:predicted CXXCH cytochrome family protein